MERLLKWAPLILILILIWMVVAVWLFGRLPFGALAYEKDMQTVAPKLILALTVIAILMERSLAVINGAWFGDETEQARGKLKAAMAANAMAAGQKRAGFADATVAPAAKAAAEAVGDAHQSLAEVEAKKKRLRLVIGCLFGIAISAVGIRTLAGLVVAEDHSAWFNLVDIILTGALLAGGSEGMAKVAELIRTAIDGTSARMSARS